jgi:hypothetical protein
MAGVRIRDGVESGGLDGADDELGQIHGGDVRWWGEYGIRVLDRAALRVGVRAGVEADQGVEVHDPAALVFGDLAVAHPEFDAVGAFPGV